MKRRYLAAAAALASILTAPAAFAWGPMGHSIVAALAQKQLNPAAQKAVSQLLAGSQWTSIVDASSWPDEIRNMPPYQKLWQHTRRMHYVNFRNADCDYVPQLCKKGECAVGAIEHYEKILADRSLPVAERRQALVFVVHFIGDIHEPLHAGYKRDAGGNMYQVQFEGHGTNLHRVWDSGLLFTKGWTWKKWTDYLAAKGPIKLPATPKGTAPAAAWAEQSCKITRNIYPAGHKIDQAYVTKNLPIVEQQLRRGGERLADVLNHILG